MNLEKLVEKVKQDFLFLINEYGFQIAYSESRNNQERVGLESKNIKMLFIKERSIDIKIGTNDLLYETDDGWINLRHVIDFVLQRPVEWVPQKMDKPYNAYLLDVLSKTANDLQPRMKKISEMFRDKQAINHWKSQFEQYMDEEIKRRFGI